MVLALATAVAGGDAETGLARLLGESSSSTLTIRSGLETGLSSAEVRKVLPGLPTSVKGKASCEPGRVETKDQMLAALELKLHQGRLDSSRTMEDRHEGNDMARYQRMDVLNAMYATGVVPVFYHPDPDVVTNVARACARGGARLLEFTNRGDFAWEVFRDLERFCARELPEMITGVGSVVDPGTATLYVNNGANFVVGPVLNPEVARTCNRRKVPYSPGCGTASEISAAEELGCEIVKIFPGAEVGGPSFVKAVKGPCPWTSVMPTGGVEPTEGSLSAWFKAGVACVGIGSNLITKEILAAKDWDGLAARVKETLALVQKVRGK